MKPTFLSLLHAHATREQLEEWCRSQTQSYAMEGPTMACRVLGKYLMFCHRRDTALTPHLALDGIWEPWITMAIARHVKPGMSCMDVGACYGYYSLLMADIVGSAGYVEAWEPVWGHYVQQNADLNGLPVEVRSAPMGTGNESFTFRVTDRSFNAGDVKLVPYRPPPASALPIVCMDGPVGIPYDFIKIDVEGAEADVWEALSDVRKVSPRLTVCMEFTPKKHENPDEFLLKLVADGFALGTVGHDGVPRACSAGEALTADTGGFRMLWLTRKNK